jgi:hypothetical protein
MDGQGLDFLVAQLTIPASVNSWSGIMGAQGPEIGPSPSQPGSTSWQQPRIEFCWHPAAGHDCAAAIGAVPTPAPPTPPPPGPVTCGPGHGPGSGGGACHPCLGNTWSDTGSHCRSCPPGSSTTDPHVTPPHSACTPCPAHQFSSDGAECRMCTPGNEVNPAQTGCVPRATGCDTQPCGIHGVSCVATGGSYTCTCASQWAGAQCLTCASGWAGAQCDHATGCDTQPCGVHGDNCVAIGGSYTCTCASGWAGPQCSQVVCPRCSSFNEFESCAATLHNLCCTTSNGVDCSSGLPIACGASMACAQMMLSTHSRCNAWLRAAPMMALVATELADAASTCTRSCTNFAEFQTNAAAVNAVCCDEPQEDCSTGAPISCNAGCASVLIPVSEACDSWLSSIPSMSPIRSALSSVASMCRGHNHGSGH